jgi:hypothetical protein
MLRRNILAVSLAPLALGACAGGNLPSSQSIAIVAQDVKIIASGLSKAFTQIQALNMPGLTPKLMDVCQQALTGIQSVADAMSGVTTVADAQPLVVKVEGYVNAFIGALSVLPLPPTIQTALIAATILLPIIETAVNLAMPPKVAATIVAPAPAMSATQARDALK